MNEFTVEDDALLAELGVEVATKKASSLTAREERIVAGFEEIRDFVERSGGIPSHGEERDIFERIYAKRLDRMRELDDLPANVRYLDHQGLLEAVSPLPNEVREIDDEELLAALGVDEGLNEITTLRHVRSNADKRAAEQIASRKRCEDFDEFEPLFDQVRSELESGARVSSVIRKDSGFLKTDIRRGEFFVLGGQTLYVAEVGEPFKAPNGAIDARLRVIYSNGTESDILLRSLQRAIYKDETSRRISESTAGPLFAGEPEEIDLATGTIYVLRSKSDHPDVEKNRDILHKIGVTGGVVERRIANARLDSTFLLADVEIVATYELYNINRIKLENLIHRIFGSARLEIKIEDRFGNWAAPREWFLVPLFVIDEAVDRIRDGSISEYVYDPESVRLVNVEGKQ